VERTERKESSAPAPEFDLQGRLGNFLLSDIIQMIGLSGKTGTLTLIEGWNTRTISFENGRICYVAAGNKLPGLFEMLIRIGRLTRQQVEAFKVRRPGRSEETMILELVSRKLLAREDIDRCNELLLETAIYTLFLWRNCEFTFKANELVREGGVAVTVDGNHLIIEGTRRVDEWIQISALVPSVFMIFRQRPHLIERQVPEHLRRVFDAVDGLRDVTSIARAARLSQFDAAKALYELVEGRFVESIPPNKQKVCELFNLTTESIYLKLVLYEHSRDALQFEHELNRFALDNGLKVRMSAGKITRSDLDSTMAALELIDRYKLFIGIQNNRLSKMFEPRVFQGLMEGLYLNADPEIKAMMRMYEFFEIDGLSILEMFEKKSLGNQPQRQRTDELAGASKSRSA
jgi:hypothetical protein